MLLNELISDIEKEFRLSEVMAEEYMHIPEVSSFIERRSADLKRFKKMIAEYSIYENVLSVQRDLRERFPNDSKFFGGICLKGSEYFKFTKKVKSAIAREQEEIERDMPTKVNNEFEETQLGFDGGFAIPDELDNETFQKLYDDFAGN